MPIHTNKKTADFSAVSVRFGDIFSLPPLLSFVTQQFCIAEAAMLLRRFHKIELILAVEQERRLLYLWKAPNRLIEQVLSVLPQPAVHQGLSTCNARVCKGFVHTSLNSLCRSSH